MKGGESTKLRDNFKPPTKLETKMNRPVGYFHNNDKATKITPDGFRINVYPSGIVTTQIPKTPHSAYSSALPDNFSNMSHQQMSDYAFNFFSTDRG